LQTIFTVEHWQALLERMHAALADFQEGTANGNEQQLRRLSISALANKLQIDGLAVKRCTVQYKAKIGKLTTAQICCHMHS
jgi:hypothetical protein